MRALHVIAGLHPKHGGPTVYLSGLCKALEDSGIDADIFTVKENGTSYAANTSTARQDFSAVPVIRNLAFSGALQRKLIEKSSHYEVIHTHGLWRMPNIYAGRAARVMNRPLVISPHGMLIADALRQSALSKKVFWHLLQKHTCDRAAIWHATSDKEAEAIRKFGVTAPIAIIPIGVDIPAKSAAHAALASCRILLCISRLHPHKGIDVLVRAWSIVGVNYPDWVLLIAGPSDASYRSFLDSLVRRHRVKNVKFADAVTDDRKAQLYETADLFVLPSKSENFGLVVAEAFAAGLPVVVTKNAPWRDVVSHSCGWQTQPDVEQLVAVLRHALGVSADQRKEMGLRGRAWMANEFGWKNVGRKMRETYDWVLGLASRPDCLHI